MVNKTLFDYKRGTIVCYEHPYGYFSEQEEDNSDEMSCYARRKVLKKDVASGLILAELIDCCDERGIILYASGYDDEVPYDTNGLMKMWEGRTIFSMKKGERNWFVPNTWCVDE